MEAIIAVLGGICLALTVYLVVYFRLIKYKRLAMLDWFLLSTATFNGIGFGFVMWFTHKGRNSYIHSYLIMNYNETLIFTYIMLSLIFLLSVFLGWCLASRISIINRNKTRAYAHSEQVYFKKIVVVAWLMFVISVISYWLFTLAYGGFVNYLSFAEARRSGVFVINNAFSFLQRFGGFAFFSSFIFFAFLIDRDHVKKKKMLILIGFILSVCFSFYVLYSWVGRVGFVFYVLTFLLGYILYTYKSTFALLRKVSFFSVAAVFLLLFSDAFLGRSGGELGIIELFTKELSFPISSFYSVFHSSEYRWFLDILIAPVFMLPMRIWSGIFNLETASSFNTFLLVGARKGDAGVYGETPVDMLTFSFMQGNLLGVLITGLIFGFTLYIIQLLIYRIPIKSIRSIINANLILYVGILTVLYGDPQHILVRNFGVIVGFMLLWLYFKLGKKGKKIIIR